MEILKKQSTAIAVMILMIVAAALYGGHSSLSDLRDRAEQVFYLGEAGDGIGIRSDLQERADSAYNLVTVARRYLPETDESLQGVLLARQALDQAASVSEMAKADQALEEAVKDLLSKLEEVNLAEKDAPYPQRLYDSFRSRGDTISHDPYNRHAAEFNETLSEFPANLFSRLTGVKELELFR